MALVLGLFEHAPIELSQESSRLKKRLGPNAAMAGLGGTRSTCAGKLIAQPLENCFISCN